ncbi:MAG: accessory factor UbiK family protein [Rhodospirillales bacterium]|nr:accessory factor UbiK family protein [Rhodospirillales bacterium]
MQSRNKLLDDLARVAGGAAGTVAGIRGEVETVVRQRIEAVLSELNLVTRDEFDAVKAVASKARAEQEKLEKRIAELEAGAARPAAKPAAKRGSAKTGTKTPAKPAAKSASKKAATKPGGRTRKTTAKRKTPATKK